MRIPGWGLAAVVTIGLAACSSEGDGGAGSFDDEVERFAASTCALESMCFGEDEAACLADVAADMADAKAALDDAGEAQCALCMRVKRIEGDEIVAADCELSAGNIDAVLAACDLDPDVDYDADGDPANDDDEACAGYP